MPAFERAWREGADGVELDVRMTADSRIVCLHDADTGRVSGKSLVVAESDYAQLQGLDVGSWKGSEFKGTPIPLLEELLAQTPGGKQVFIDAKEAGPAIVPALLEVIEGSRVEPKQVFILTTDPETAKAVRAKNTSIKILWSIEARSNWMGRYKLNLVEVLDTLIELKMNGLALKSDRGIKRPVSRSILEADAHLNVWGVGSAEEARRFAGLGISSLTTDDPSAILKAFR